MAYERVSDVKVRGEGLDVFIQNQMTLFKNQLAARNAADELRFHEAVLSDNLPLADQLAYRKNQLKRVSDDPEERKRIRLEIANLNNRAEQADFTDQYLQELSDHAAGVTSIDSIITWLEDQLAVATDETLQSTIQEQLVQKRKEKFPAAKNLVENQTKFALADRTAEILDGQIGRVSAERTKALLADNQELVSVYDLQIQSLTKAKNENAIEKDIKNFAVATITGYASALNLLDAYNSKISSAGSAGSVRIGDITYASPKEFWTFKRDSYLADAGESGFFSRYSLEKTTDLKVKNSRNALTTDDLRRVSADYDSLAARPELANYQFKITSTKQDAIQTGANLFSASVINRYAQTLNVNDAFASINSLKAVGVNVEDAYTKILSAAAAVKETQVSNILNLAKDLTNPLSPNYDPNLTMEQALNKALVSGAGIVLSPTQLVSKTEEEITTEQAKGAAAGAFTPETRATAALPNQPDNVPPVVPSAPSTPAAASLPTPAILINKSLDFGVRDPQVRELQKFLNKQGFLVASSGEGAPGAETDYFGPLTQAALKKFQASQGIVSSGDPLTTGYGRVGPKTLARISELLQK